MTHEFEMNLQKLMAQPMKVKEVLTELHDCYPKEVSRAMHFAVNGKHLDEELMEEALATITRYDGAKAPFWSMEDFRDILKKTNISLVGQAYNEYDLNYLTQYYLADFKSLGQDPVKFICMAVDRLHDVDDPHASEKAYHSAVGRIAKHK
jgi:hypothetical protein